MSPPDHFFADAAMHPRRALVGFDGFVDSLYRVIRDHQGGTRNPYNDIPEFGREVLSRAGKSGGFELVRQSVQAGGNGPLLSVGLGALGVATTCVGALGMPETDPAFGTLRQAGCDLVSTAPAALTTALEFDDGKLMLNDARAFESLGWEALEQAVGLERLRALAAPADLVALVGWANMPRATDLWRGVLEHVLPPGGGTGHKKIFVDLADISRAGGPELHDLIGLLRRFRTVGEVALGLNENEALKLGARLGLADFDSEGAGEDLDALTLDLHGLLGLDLLVVHPRQGARVVGPGGLESVTGRLVAKPVLSTGAGDQFNAGFCFGWLHGLRPGQAAELGCRVSSFYVERGRSPVPGEVEAPFSGAD